MNQLTFSKDAQTQVLTMSSIEIAKITGKRHLNVIRDIRQMLDKLDDSILSHEEYQELKDERGYTSEFLLNKNLTLTLMTGYDVNTRHKINIRWQELEHQVKQPQELSKLEVLQMAIESEKQRVALEQQVSVLEPKALALDAIADTSNTYTIRECATTIKIKEKELVNLIIDKGWCYRDASSRLRPYAQKVQQGVFINRASPVITHPVTQEEKVYLHMHVTAYGLTRLTALVNRHRGG